MSETISENPNPVPNTGEAASDPPSSVASTYIIGSATIRANAPEISDEDDLQLIMNEIGEHSWVITSEEFIDFENNARPGVSIVAQVQSGDFETEQSVSFYYCMDEYETVLMPEEDTESIRDRLRAAVVEQMNSESKRHLIAKRFVTES